MLTAAQTANRRTLRTLLQLIAAGGFTGIIGAISGELSTLIGGLLSGALMLAVVWSQNRLEATGAIPTVLPTATMPGRENESLPLIAHVETEGK